MNKLTQKLNENIAKAQYQLELMSGVIASHNYVIVFLSNFTTLASDGEGRPVINPRVIASQFTKERAKYYADRITNGSGEKPVAMLAKEYYELYIADLQKTLEEVSE